MKKIIAIALGISCISPANAVTDVNLSVLAVGSQAGTGAYFAVPATSGGCPGGLIYVDISSDVGRGILSILLTARAGGRPIARVDYHTVSVSWGTGTQCWADLVQL